MMDLMIYFMTPIHKEPARWYHWAIFNAIIAFFVIGIARFYILGY